jgi:hypothetical protein
MEFSIRIIIVFVKNSGKKINGVVLVILGICKASYGWTDLDETFLRSTNERSILNLAIPFANLVQLPPTISLTAVKHASLGFFQLNKDP